MDGQTDRQTDGRTIFLWKIRISSDSSNDEARIILTFLEVDRRRGWSRGLVGLIIRRAEGLGMEEGGQGGNGFGLGVFWGIGVLCALLHLVGFIRQR